MIRSRWSIKLCRKIGYWLNSLFESEEKPGKEECTIQLEKTNQLLTYSQHMFLRQGISQARAAIEYMEDVLYRNLEPVPGLPWKEDKILNSNLHQAKDWLQSANQDIDLALNKHDYIGVDEETGVYESELCD